MIIRISTNALRINQYRLVKRRVWNVYSRIRLKRCIRLYISPLDSRIWLVSVWWDPWNYMPLILRNYKKSTAEFSRFCRVMRLENWFAWDIRSSIVDRRSNTNNFFSCLDYTLHGIMSIVLHYCWWNRFSRGRVLQFFHITRLHGVNESSKLKKKILF